MTAALGYLEHLDGRLLGVARANAGKGGYTVFAQELARMTGVNLQRLPWCAVFVHWAFCKAFGASQSRRILGRPHPGCRVLARRMKRRKLWRGTEYIPRKWDIVFCANDGSCIDHCGIVESCDGHTVTSIDGNAADPSGVLPKDRGGCVARRQRPADSPVIRGYAQTGTIAEIRK